MAPRAIAVPLIDPGFPDLKSRIIERTGHFYYQDKDDLLWERVRKRLRATGLSGSTQYLSLLDDAISGPAEWGKLEAEITIGETFFFRYAEQFAALRETILPEIIDRKGGTQRLRIWSAGCSTGAEPYSLAVLVKEILGERLGTWRVSIVGTDINDSFLTLARQARFGKWALRSMPATERDRYFLDAGKDQWQVRPEFRSLVRFEKHNLLSLLDGTSPLELTDFDLILCRNVLIYFHPDTVVRIVEALRDRLTEGGWMLLGHAEPNPAFSALMQTLNLPGTVAYRPGAGTASSAAAVEPVSPVSQDWAPLLPPPKRIEPAKPRRLDLPATVPSQPQAPNSSQGPGSLLEEVRASANTGDFATADALCRRALIVEPLRAALHFYHGLILQGLRRPDEAEKSFLKSIYLDKSFAMAHYHLGLLLLAEGRSTPGRRALTNAARIAAAMPDDNLLDEADGLTAGDLRNLIRIHLEAATPPQRRS
ncbi:CheR family methyltransferase [Microvirga lotononidis]|uniref:protein-glutamate O-methyltransferase n=1 Tax=Microvirga lotononidis TaxID=864069 RepID=I4YT27_9HYPH|nr:protein-glutamate O-methyltransferase CheR [Microvirga lotononidis]EIM27119.1 methylase of chemotaxis methyl-accepting protein [Microvirga lotononidis]WQO28693.1 CheR family methyltransferase [Microvirga lotononidis]